MIRLSILFLVIVSTMLLSAILSPAYATGCTNESKASQEDKDGAAAVAEETDGTPEPSDGTTTAEEEGDSEEPAGTAIDFDDFESVQLLELDDGIVYAIWQDRSVGNGDVFFARSEDGGEIFDEPINLSNNERFALLDMAIVATGDGNIYVAWIDFEGGDPPQDQGAISFAKSTNDGETFDDAITIGEENIMDRNNLHMQASGNNNVYLTWIGGSFEEFAGQLIFASSDDAGETFNLAELVEGHAVSDAPEVAVSDETIYVAGDWSTSRDTSDGSAADNIFFQRSTNGGQTFEESVVIDTGSPGGFANFESLDVEDDGSVRITWEKGETFDEREIFSAVSTNGGETFSDPEAQ